ncbi:MAG TPA: hypothetical protein O0X42_01815 [Methanocorpusculum sp.]|nr:hypothetical protein [Methanocorpusculum sp.]
MHLLHSIQHKACADGSYMKEYVTDEPVPAGFFEYLKHFGRVELLAALGEGYYSFSKPGWFSIKAFAGDTSVEVRFTRETMDITTDFLRMLFLAYHDDMEIPEIDALKAKEKVRDEQIRKIIGQ